MIRALAVGTALSLLVVGAWSVTAAATIGGVPALHLTWRHPLAAYMTLAAAPTGNGWALFAVTAAMYTLCPLTAGWRGRGAR